MTPPEVRSVNSLPDIRYHVPTHIQEHIDYITSGIKLFAGKRRPNPNSDLEKRGYLLPPLLKFLAWH
jgi:tripeptidyl-peptidase-1